MNVTVLVAFTFDYIVGIGLAESKSRYFKDQWMSLLIIAAQGAALVPGLAGAGGLRILRAGRLWRVIAILGRLGAVGGVAATEGRTIIRRHAASVALAVAGLTWLSSAVGFTLAEDVGTDGRLQSFFDGLWWSAATITTVGYGDVFPMTAAGRMIGAVTMIVGISTFAVLTAKIAEFLVRAQAEDRAPPSKL